MPGKYLESKKAGDDTILETKGCHFILFIFAVPHHQGKTRKQ